MKNVSSKYKIIVVLKDNGTVECKKFYHFDVKQINKYFIIKKTYDGVKFIFNGGKERAETVTQLLDEMKKYGFLTWNDIAYYGIQNKMLVL